MQKSMTMGDYTISRSRDRNSASISTGREHYFANAYVIDRIFRVSGARITNRQERGLAGYRAVLTALDGWARLPGDGRSPILFGEPED